MGKKLLAVSRCENVFFVMCLVFLWRKLCRNVLSPDGFIQLEKHLNIPKEIALCAYYAMVCLSAVSWYFFTLKIPNIKVGVSGSKYFVTEDISKR